MAERVEIRAEIIAKLLAAHAAVVEAADPSLPAILIDDMLGAADAMWHYAMYLERK